MTKAMAYVLITVKHGSSQEVAKELLKYSEVFDVHELFGQYDLILKTALDSTRELSEFVHDKIISVPEVESTETLVISDVIDEV